jgi:hypothetical protein
MDLEKDTREKQLLAENLARIAHFLTQAESARLFRQASTILTVGLEKEADDREAAILANGLATLLSSAPPLDAEKLSRRAAKTLSLKMEKGTADNPWMVEALSSMRTYYLPPSEAVEVLEAKFNKPMEPWTSSALAERLSSTVSRLPPGEAAKVCGRVARVLATSLSRETDWHSRLAWSIGLSNVARAMTVDEAERVVANAIRDLLRLRVGVSGSLYGPSFEFQYRASVCDGAIAELIPHIGDEKAGILAQELAFLMCSEAGDNERWQLASAKTTNLNLIITNSGRQENVDKAWIAGGTNDGSYSPAGKPLRCRLTSQELLDLLKMPTCIGVARRIVLDHLGNRYHRHFINHWAFVRYARESGLNLDLTTPPHRPNPRESLERMIAVLGAGE